MTRQTNRQTDKQTKNQQNAYHVSILVLCISTFHMISCCGFCGCCSDCGGCGGCGGYGGCGGCGCGSLFQSTDARSVDSAQMTVIQYAGEWFVVNCKCQIFTPKCIHSAPFQTIRSS